MSEVGIIISAEDKASAVFDKIGKSGALSFDKLKSSTTKVGERFAKMPDQLGKASTAMLLFQNSTAQMSGKFADAANKITAVIGLVATGGPLGVALAAMTLIVGAVSSAWDAHTRSTREAERAMADVSAQTLETLRSVKDLDRELEDFGKSSLQAEIDRMKSDIELKEELISKDEEAIKTVSKLRKGTADLVVLDEKFGDLVADNVIVSKEEIAVRKRQVSADRQKLQKLIELSDKTKAQTGLEKKAAAAEREAAEATRKHAEELRRLAAQAKEMEKIGARMFAEQDKIILGLNQDINTLSSRLGNLSGAMSAGLKKIPPQIKKINDEAAAMASTTANVINEMLSNTVNTIIDTEKTAAEKFQALSRLMRETAIKTILELIAARIRAAVIETTSESAAAKAATASTAARIAETNATITAAAVKAAAAKAGIAADAAEGAAAAGKSQAGIPIIGPILAASAAAAIFALISKFATKFEFGGIVRGGTPNKDSVPALLMPGETVLTQRETKALRNGQRAQQPTQVNQQIVIRSDVPPTDTDYRKAVRRVAKEQHKLRRRGLVPA